MRHGDVDNNIVYSTFYASCYINRYSTTIYDYLRFLLYNTSLRFTKACFVNFVNLKEQFILHFTNIFCKLCKLEV